MKTQQADGTMTLLQGAAEKPYDGADLAEDLLLHPGRDLRQRPSTLKSMSLVVGALAVVTGYVAIPLAAAGSALWPSAAVNVLLTALILVEVFLLVVYVVRRTGGAWEDAAKRPSHAAVRIRVPVPHPQSAGPTAHIRVAVRQRIAGAGPARTAGDPARDSARDALAVGR